MPSRWPRAARARACRARARRATSRSSIRRRLSGARRRRRRSAAARQSPERQPAVDRPAEAVEHAPEQLARRRRARNGLPVARDGVARADPAHARRAASAACGRRGSRRPRPAIGWRLRPTAIVQSSPTSARRPGRLDHEADQARDAAAAAHAGRRRATRVERTRSSAACRHARAGGDASRSSLGRRSSCSGRRASISPSDVRTTQPPRPTRRSARDLDRRAAELVAGRRSRRATSVEVVRVAPRSRSGRDPRCGAARPRRRRRRARGSTSSAAPSDLLGERDAPARPRAARPPRRTPRVRRRDRCERRVERRAHAARASRRARREPGGMPARRGRASRASGLDRRPPRPRRARRSRRARCGRLACADTSAPAASSCSNDERPLRHAIELVLVARAAPRAMKIVARVLEPAHDARRSSTAPPRRRAGAAAA